MRLTPSEQLLAGTVVFLGFRLAIEVPHKPPTAALTGDDGDINAKSEHDALLFQAELTEHTAFHIFDDALTIGVRVDEVTDVREEQALPRVRHARPVYGEWNLAIQIRDKSKGQTGI